MVSTSYPRSIKMVYTPLFRVHEFHCCAIDDLLIFVRLYRSENESLVYIGHFLFSQHQTLRKRPASLQIVYMQLISSLSIEQINACGTSRCVQRFQRAHRQRISFIKLCQSSITSLNTSQLNRRISIYPCIEHWPRAYRGHHSSCNYWMSIKSILRRH